MIIARAFLVVFAFLMACVAAGLVVSIAVLAPTWSDLALGPVEDPLIGLVFAFGVLFVSGKAVLGSLLVVSLAEIFGVRSVLFYATAGALSGAAIYASLGHIDLTSLQINGLARRELEIMAAAGIVGGYVYWLIAGRTARGWRNGRDRPPPLPTP